MERAVARASASTWVRERAEIGDLILIGSRDPVSRVIQRASNSRFSHAAVVTDHGEVTEAYDYSLTLNEQDEGIYRTDFEMFLKRTPKLHSVLILRPEGLDRAKLRTAAKQLYRRAPPYPTIGATMLGFIRLFSESIPRLDEGLFKQNRVGKRLHRLLDALARAQVGFVGDDIHKVHCAESVVHIYEAAGFAVRLPHTFLERSAERASQITPNSNRSGPNGRNPTPGIPQPTTRRGRQSRTSIELLTKLLTRPDRAARSLFKAWKWRMDHRDVAGAADYTFPGDLERADGFTLIGEVPVVKNPGPKLRRGTAWRRGSKAKRVPSGS